MSQFRWTDEAEARIRQLWCEDKLTAANIAFAISAEFGCALGRNAILGKIHRLGLSGQGPGQGWPARVTVAAGAPAPRPLNGGASPAPEPPVAVAPRASAPRASPAPVPEPPAYVPPAEGLTLAEMTLTMCRYAITPDMARSHRFCAHQTVEGQPWCRAHMQMVYVPKPPPAVRSPGQRRVA